MTTKHQILPIDDENGVRRCYPLMAQLRPHLASAQEFTERWRRQADEGYQLIALQEGERVLALAGFRVQENLVHGRFLYVDDLVTDASLRSHGYGEILISFLKNRTQELACSKLVLDTALSNSLGQRFYFRNGLLATSLRFNFLVKPKT